MEEGAGDPCIGKECADVESLLTGNPEADANIRRFYAARACLLRSASLLRTSSSSDVSL
jgi:hypothetical protein